jgi:hypothetical protein
MSAKWSVIGSAVATLSTDPGPWRPATRPSSAGVALRSLAGLCDPATVLAFCAVFVLVMFLPPILNDGDTLWQIRAGAWILDHRAIPAVDPFSFTAGDRPWLAHEWLAETLLAVAWRAAGMAGVMVLAAAAIGFTASVLLRTFRRFLPGIYAVLALTVALANAAPSMLARPHVLAWPCLALWCAGLVVARANRTAPRWPLLIVMLIWVNLHGSFMVGLVLAPAFLLEALFEPGADRRRVLLHWGGFSLAALLVALINPDGIAGVLFPFHMLGMSSTAWIGEWQPTDFGRLQLLELMILAGLVLGLAGKVRPPPVRLLLLLGLIHAALSHARNEQLLGIVGVLILAEPIGETLGRGGAVAGGVFWRRFAAGAGAAAAIALVVRLALPLAPERTGAAFAATLAHVPAELWARPVFNEYGLGGALIFQGVRPFIDSRADLYGDAFLARYHRIVAPNREALTEALAEYRIEWTILRSEMLIVSLMDDMPGWRRVYESDGVVIHARLEGGR